MTAEIFLAVFLASLLVAVVQWMFVLTVYLPAKRWLANRAWDRLGKEGPSAVLATFPAASPEIRRMFDAEQDLHIAVLDLSDEQPDLQALLVRARAYRDSLPMENQVRMRAMAAHRNVEREAETKARASV